MITNPTTDWINLGLGLDGAVLVGYMAAFYKYGDRTDIYKNSLAGVRDLLVSIERDIAFQLAVRLQPVFNSVGTVIEVVSLFQPDGTLFKEVSVNPVGSEKYREAILDFVLAHTDAMHAYREVTVAREGWVKWAQRLSRGLLFGMVFHGTLGFALLGVRFTDFIPSPQIIVAVATFCFCVIVFAFLCLAVMMGCHDRILKYRHTYGID